MKVKAVHVRNIILVFKDILPQNEKVFLLLCSPVNLSKSQHLSIIWKIEEVFSYFYRSIFDAPFCYLVVRAHP